MKIWGTIGLLASGLVGIAFLVTALAELGARPGLAEILGDRKPEITVYGKRSCGCCGAWVRQLQKAGFEVSSTEADETHAARRTFADRTEMASCHTAMVDGYAIEGHVPVEVIVRLLQERPEIVGLAVAGMPVGSPGMERSGESAGPYDVMAMDRHGNISVYARR